MSQDEITPARLRERAQYYEDWARDIRALNGTSVDADYSDATAAALRAAADQLEAAERERNARAADIAKWLAALGEHLSPHQEESLTVIDAALRASVAQRAEMERMNDQIVAMAMWSEADGERECLTATLAVREALLRRAMAREKFIRGISPSVAAMFDEYDAPLAAEIAAALEETQHE